MSGPNLPLQSQPEVTDAQKWDHGGSGPSLRMGPVLPTTAHRSQCGTDSECSCRCCPPPSDAVLVRGGFAVAGSSGDYWVTLPNEFFVADQKLWVCDSFLVLEYYLGYLVSVLWYDERVNIV